MKPGGSIGVSRDMRQFAVLSLALVLLAFGHAVNPLERMAANQAATEAAKPYLRSATYQAAVDSQAQVQLAYKKFNDGVAEMRKRNATPEERIAFANATRKDVELRHAERVWGFLSNRERSLMTRLALKEIGPQILRYEEAGAMIGLSKKQREHIAAQYKEHQDRAGKVMRVLSDDWRKKLEGNPLPMERYEIDKEYRKQSEAAYAELEKAKAKLGQRVVNSFTSAQRKRWTELTTLPRP